MALTRLLAAVLSLALMPSPTAPPATPRDTLLVSTAWLAQHLHDADVVLLHVGEKSEYDARHIPGARDVDAHRQHAGRAALQVDNVLRRLDRCF